MQTEPQRVFWCIKAFFTLLGSCPFLGSRHRWKDGREWPAGNLTWFECFEICGSTWWAGKERYLLSMKKQRAGKRTSNVKRLIIQLSTCEQKVIRAVAIWLMDTASSFRRQKQHFMHRKPRQYVPPYQYSSPGARFGVATFEAHLSSGSKPLVCVVVPQERRACCAEGVLREAMPDGAPVARF